MPDEKGDLYLFEAIELRKEYDRHIKLIENLLEDQTKRERFFHDTKEEEKEPAADFDQKELIK